MSMHTPVQTMKDVRQTIVLAYQEDVAPLVAALEKEGFAPHVQRAVYTDEELTYTRNSRCMLNHKAAWERAARSEGYTLICESDFVPCVGMGSFPVFWPLGDPRAWGYLYQGSPRLLALVGEEPWLRGHCAPLVAYVINAEVARNLLLFFEYELSKYALTEFFTFDAHLQWFVMGKDCRAYIPLRHYGEHGGMPNREHKEMGLPRAGVHRADNLQKHLHFLPQYARGSRLTYLKVRLLNRGLGWLRLFSGRWMTETNVYHWTRLERMRMLGWGLRRLV